MGTSSDRFVVRRYGVRDFRVIDTEDLLRPRSLESYEAARAQREELEQTAQRVSLVTERRQMKAFRTNTPPLLR